MATSRWIVDNGEAELKIPEAYNQDVLNSVNSHQEALSMIQQLEEFSKSVLKAYNICGWWSMNMKTNFLSVPEMCNIGKYVTSVDDVINHHDVIMENLSLSNLCTYVP
jgi:hypothetical protein